MGGCAPLRWYFHNGVWKNGYYDRNTGVFIAGIKSKIITVIANVKPQYVENLKSAQK